MKIEKNVPIPGPRAKWPLLQMEKGDSFFVSAACAGNLRNAISVFNKKKKTSARFITRKVDGGIRIWRIE